MSAPEVLALTEALIGDRVLHWDNESIVVDCHCLGGVPGNKTDTSYRHRGRPMACRFPKPVPIR